MVDLTSTTGWKSSIGVLIFQCLITIQSLIVLSQPQKSFHSHLIKRSYHVRNIYANENLNIYVKVSLITYVNVYFVDIKPLVGAEKYRP